MEDLLAAIVFFEQAMWFGGILVDEEWVGRRAELEKLSEQVISAQVRSFQAVGCMVMVEGNSTWRRVRDISVAAPGRLIQIAEQCEAAKSTTHDEWKRNAVNNIASAVESGTMGVESVARALSRFHELGLLGSREGERLIQALKGRLLTEARGLEDFEVLAEFVDVCRNSIEDDELVTIRGALEMFADEYEPDEDDAASPDALREIASRFSNVGDVIGVDVSHREGQLREEADEIERDNPPDWEPEDDGSRSGGDGCSDVELDSMFGTLEE